MRIMDKLEVFGAKKLKGNVYISGSKNASLPILAATLLSKKKVTLVTTSNTHPDNLYKDGLHRSRFLPAIESIKKNCEIYELDSEQDYRLRTLEQLEIFVIGKNEEGIREDGYTTHLIRDDAIKIIENIPILPLKKPWKVRPVLGINSDAKFIILNIFYFLWLISSLSWAASS